MITATNEPNGKINSKLQLSTLVGRGMQNSRHLCEVLDTASPDSCHQACRPIRSYAARGAHQPHQIDGLASM
jgi:hypothetical protein